MPLALFVLLFFAFANCSFAETPAWHSPPSERFVVVTTNGRSYGGMITTASTSKKLVLENRSDTIAATTVIPTANVISIQPARLTEEFQTAEHSETGPSDEQHPIGVVPAELLMPTMKPDWIETAAQLKNFDEDAYPDGIEVRVVGMSKQGHSVPLHGTVDMSLVSLYQRRLDVPPKKRRVDRWTRRIEAKYWQGDELVFTLRFRGHPECDWKQFEWSQLTVRVNQPGHGSWNATTPVLLRVGDPYQEDLLLQDSRWSIGYGPRGVR